MSRALCTGGLLAWSLLSGACAGENAAPAETARWEELYKDSTPEDLTIERKELQQVLSADANPYYEDAFASGHYEVVGHYATGEPYSFEAEPEVLCAYRFLPNGIVGRVVLPAERFPEQYRLKRQVEWLLAHEQQL